MRKKIKKAFTVVELVVVIAVIAILASVSVGVYFGVTISANNSKLDQEAKMAHTNIQLVSNTADSGSSLSTNGLTISNVNTFSSALTLMSGLDYDLALTEPNTISKRTIYFVKSNLLKSSNSNDNLFECFAYYNPEISGKRALVDVVTGERRIEDKNFEISSGENNQPSEEPTVSVPSYVMSVEMEDDIELYVGESKAVNVTVNTSNVDDKSYTLSVKQGDSVIISNDGLSIIAVKAGSSIIRATSNYNPSVFAYGLVTVYEKVYIDNFNFEIGGFNQDSSYSASVNSDISIDVSVATKGVNQGSAFNVQVIDNGIANYEINNTTISLHLHDVGEVKIIATAVVGPNDQPYSETFTILSNPVYAEFILVSGLLNETNLELGNSLPVTVSVDSKATNQEWDYRIEGKSIKFENNEIISLKTGTSTIEFFSKDGSATAKQSFIINVIKTEITLFSVTVSKSTLKVLETAQIITEVEPSSSIDASVSYSVPEEYKHVLSCSDTGLVKILETATPGEIGVVVVTSNYDSSKTAELIFTVARTSVENISIVLGKDVISQYETTSIHVNILPLTATNKDYDIVFIPSNAVTYNQENKTITANSVGTVLISVTTHDGNINVRKTLNVEPVLAEGIEYDPIPDVITVDYVNTTHNLNARVVNNASNLNINYTSTDTSVADVSNSGVITYKAPGKTTIKLSSADGNIETEFDVNILRRIYLVPASGWANDNAEFAVYDNDKNEWLSNMTALSNQIYKADVDISTSNIIFGRMNPNRTENSFEDSNILDRTEVFTLVANKNYFRITTVGSIETQTYANCLNTEFCPTRIWWSTNSQWLYNDFHILTSYYKNSTSGKGEFVKLVNIKNYHYYSNIPFNTYYDQIIFARMDGEYPESFNYCQYKTTPMTLYKNGNYWKNKQYSTDGDWSIYPDSCDPII